MAATFDPNIPSKIPRVNFKDRIAFKQLSDGFLVYQTDKQKGFYYFQDGAWFFLQSASASAGTIRPLKPFVGQSFFDTTLGYRIDWNGTNWVNTNGTTV